MALETATYVGDLNTSNPPAGDNISQGDDHIRLIKSAIQAGWEPTSWTPKLQDISASDAESQTYTTQTGYYVKIGRLVYFTGLLQMSSLGTLSGNARIAGLPFTSDATFGSAVTNFRSPNLSLGNASESVQGFIVGNTDYVQLEVWDSTLGVTSLQISEIQGTASMYFSGFYLASS